jgi:flavin-dependent dehydrogenase
MKKIIIVGGGTAGWMTAAYLAKYRGGENITIIESPTIPTIGVGESVTPHVCNFFTEIGIKEHDWMAKTGAVYKFANKFINWKGNNDEQYFSFNYTVPSDNFYKDIPVNRSQEDFKDSTDKNRSIDIINKLCSNNTFDRFDRFFNPQHYYMENNTMPYHNDNFLLNQPFAHAHHINAELAGAYIRDKAALPAGVNQIIGTVKNVETSGENITSLELDTGETLSADLYIDCTGFARILTRALDWKTKTYDTPIDSAWVCPTDYDDQKSQMVNYTKTVAEPYGWRFNIGVYHRMGNGYCYSSDYISDEDAKEYLMSKVGPTRKDPKLIKWKPGRLEKMGSGNCAAIGLSCGFIEPMEANVLYTIITSIRRLNVVLDNDVLDFDVYNEKMAHTIDDIMNFIFVHYTLSPRNDTPFWRDMQKIGIEKNHKQLVIDKINNKKNTMLAATQGYTLFPDYMWAQLAVSWDIDFAKISSDDVEVILAQKYFEYSEDKHKFISKQCENNYQWHRDNIFKMSRSEWENKYI